MKKQIRRGVFETNSSSMHSISIANDYEEKNIRKYIYFNGGEFGWGYEKHNDTLTKASYLYTMIMEYSHNTEEDIEKLKNILDMSDIEYDFEEVSKDEHNCNDWDAHIDHQSADLDFVNEVLSDTNKLFAYLFNTESYIIIDNDNH